MAQTTFRPASKAASSKSTPAPASSRENKEKKTISNDTTTMPLGTINYVLMGVSLLLIVVGFALMSGSGNTGSEWNPDIFASRRIVVAPLVTFLGFILMAPAILWRKKADRVPVDAILNESEAADIESTMTGPAPTSKPLGYVMIVIGLLVMAVGLFYLKGIIPHWIPTILGLLLFSYGLKEAGFKGTKKRNNNENKS